MTTGQAGSRRRRSQRPRHDQPAEAAAIEEQRRTAGTLLSIEDLVGARVVTSSGEPRGTVVDVRTTSLPELRVIGLIVGGWGWLQRLRVAATLRHRVPQATRLREIPWEAVERWDGLRVVLRDEAPARDVEVEPGPTGATEPGKPLEPEQPESTRAGA